MEEQGVAVNDVTSDELRASLYSKEVCPSPSQTQEDYTSLHQSLFAMESMQRNQMLDHLVNSLDDRCLF